MLRLASSGLVFTLHLPASESTQPERAKAAKQHTADTKTGSRAAQAIHNRIPLRGLECPSTKRFAYLQLRHQYSTQSIRTAATGPETPSHQTKISPHRLLAQLLRTTRRSTAVTISRNNMRGQNLNHRLCTSIQYQHETNVQKWRQPRMVAITFQMDIRIGMSPNRPWDRPITGVRTNF